MTVATGNAPGGVTSVAVGRVPAWGMTVATGKASGGETKVASGRSSARSFSQSSSTQAAVCIRRFSSASAACCASRALRCAVAAAALSTSAVVRPEGRTTWAVPVAAAVVRVGGGTVAAAFWAFFRPLGRGSLALCACALLACRRCGLCA